MKRRMMIAMAVTLMVALGLGGTSFAGNGNMRSNGPAAGIDDGNSDNPQDGIKERFRQTVRWHHRLVLHRLFHCLKDLNLSDETKQAIKDLVADYRTTAQERREAYSLARKTYWEVITAPVLDDAALAAAEEAMIGIVTDGMNAKFDLAYAIRGLLTEDEIAQLSTCFDFSIDDNQNDDLADDLDDN